MRRLAAVLLGCAALGAAFAGLPGGGAQGPGPLGRLDNLSRVSDVLYRSGQPDREQFEALVRDLGVKSVLNLRLAHDDGEEAEGLGLSLFHIPMRAGNIRQEQILRAVAILDECPKPALVHCWHGSDRTGCVVAVYRMVFQGWPRERAIAEFKGGGFGYHEGWYPNIEAYLRSVDVEALRTRPSTRGPSPPNP